MFTLCLQSQRPPSTISLQTTRPLDTSIAPSKKRVELLNFTLDTNCIIDVACNRSGAAAVRALSSAHVEGRANVALVAASASERQIGYAFLDNYADFKARIAALDLNHLPVLLPIFYWNIGFWDVGLWADAVMVERERSIHEVLFPSIPFEWTDFAAALGVPPDAIDIPEANRWRNCLCDRQMFWAHDHHRRDVFVTNDANFRKRLGRSEAFRTARIATPGEAVALIGQ